jgi:AraC-like DNA-binding protein/DNA-binding CsgD family transcriptional regulator
MVELTADGLRIAAEVASIAEAPLSIPERAEALLEPLGRVVPFEGAWISLLDPERRVQPPLVSRGYNDGLTEYMSGPAGVEEIELLRLYRLRGAMRLCDLPVPLEQVYSWTQFLAPAGYRGGLAVGLFAPDGRHLGILGLNTDTCGHPTEAGRDLIGALASVIAHALDPMRSVTAAARIITNAHAGVVLTRGANTVPLPGLGVHPLLVAGSPLLSVAARQLADGCTHASFLCPYAGPETQGRHVRVTVLRCPTQPPYHLTAVVVLSPPGDLHGLTGRELEILGLLIEGWSNRRIAAALDISEYTMAVHLEHILLKVEAPTRTLAMLRAARWGLYVPRSLTGSPCSERPTTGHGLPAYPAPDKPIAVLLPILVKRVVEAIEARPDSPFTISTLAQVAHVSARTLQEAFRRHMGISPMSYLQQVRLSRAHDDLRHADVSHFTVARIAHRWGFSHLGRFAAAYRTKYGVNPSHTLRSGGPDEFHTQLPG